MNARSLLRSGIAYAAGDGSVTLGNAIVFTVVLRYLTPADFGYLSIAQSISSWVQPILFMGATQVAVRLIAAHTDAVRSIAARMIGLRLAAAAVVSSCTVAAALRSEDRNLSRVLLAYALLFFFYAIQPDFIAIGVRRPRVYSLAKAGGSVCFLATLFFLIARIKLRAWMVPLAYAGALSGSAIYGYVALWPMLRESRQPIEISIPRLFRGAAAVLVAQFFQFGQYYIDVLILTTWKVVPVPIIGEYSAVSRLVGTGALPLTALIYSLAPMYVKQFATGDVAAVKHLERRFRISVILVGLTGAVLIVAIGPRLLEFVGGRPMPSTHHLVYIFAIGYVLAAIHNSYTAALIYAGATHFYVATYGLGLLGTIMASIILVPRFGATGSAWSMVVGLAAILVSSRYFHRHFLRTSFARADVRDSVEVQ